MAQETFVSISKYSAPVMTLDSGETQKKRRGGAVASVKYCADEHVCHTFTRHEQIRIVTLKLLS